MKKLNKPVKSKVFKYAIVKKYDEAGSNSYRICRGSTKIFMCETTVYVNDKLKICKEKLKYFSDMEKESNQNL